MQAPFALLWRGIKVVFGISILLLWSILIFENRNKLGVVYEKPRRDWRVGGEQDIIYDEKETNRKVVIAAVSCRNESDENMKKYREEPVVMIKSVLLSARLYGITKLDVHLFLEHVQDEEFFSKKLKEMGYPNDDTTLEVFFHPAITTIPEKYRDHMIYHPRYRCGYVRFFLPSALPKVDSIIHVDSDMLVTGNIWKLWNQIGEFTGEQLLGAARSNESNDTYHLKGYRDWFGDIPHPPPKGINAGLMLMNLTRMRDMQWEKRFLRVYEDYSKLVTLTGQRTLNILLGMDPGLLNMISCKYNFCNRHCDRGFTCEDAVMDPEGIYLVHGNGFTMEKNGTFHQLYKSYRKFDMKNFVTQRSLQDQIQFVKRELMEPIRIIYQSSWMKTVSKWSRCYGTLNHLLFRDFFKEQSAKFRVPADLL